MQNVWMVRASGGKYADDFVDNGYVGINFDAKVDLSPVTTRDAIEGLLRQAGHPEAPNAVGQIFRLRSDIPVGELVVTYDRAKREYPIGEITGGYQYRPSAKYPHQRPVKWLGRVKRDDLSDGVLGSLGSLLTIFRLSNAAAVEMVARLQGKPPPVQKPTEEVIEDPEVGTVLRAEVAEKAREFVKDRVVRLSWDQMQELVAGVLRAMGYKTRVSPSGPDRGKDIIASPDGLGLQDPRIIGEVKHRDGSMGAPDVRSFIAGLRDQDRGLYVSTGGFTKEAYYEAERAKVPVTLLDLDDLVELLIEHYDNVDKETTALVPLRPIYWPVD